MAKKMTYFDWFDTYQPIKNDIDPNASYDGHMFETYGPEIAKVEAADDFTVWTIVDDDEGNPIIVEGFHLVNRIGHFITAKPYTLGETYHIDD